MTMHSWAVFCERLGSPMTRVLCFLGAVLLLGACAEEKASKVGFMKPCSSTPRTDCMGAAGQDCPNKDSCAEGLQCLNSPAGLVCTAHCSGDAECGFATTSVCGSTGVCELFCGSQNDCDPYGLTCTSAQSQSRCR